MALKFTIQPYTLDFLFEAGTSRGVLSHKKTWFISAFDTQNEVVIGVGEASPLTGLSIDDIPNYEQVLFSELKKIEGGNLPRTEEEIYKLAGLVNDKYPSIRFGLEMALLDLFYGGIHKFFHNSFYDKMESIRINGLVWMGNAQLMQQRLKAKIEEGFTCIKVKIGAIDYEDEIRLLENTRKQYKISDLELRVDANGAFSYEEAKFVLSKLEKIGIHSIEQPIKAGQIELMANLCSQTPVPIALDEELIGVTDLQEKKKLLQQIMPQFIILKPSLLGGFASCLEWIRIAEQMKIRWWITSALESNIGLNAICQFASSLSVELPQGLGTGGLYANNIDSPLTLKGESIYYEKSKKWGSFS